MKILFFSDTYLPNRDGVVSAIQELRKEFGRLGHKTFIFAPGKAADQGEGVRLFPSVPFFPYPQYKVAIFPHGTLAPARKIKPDVIHSHALATMAVSASMCAKRLGVPSIATFHTRVTDATHYVSKNPMISGALQTAGWAYLKWLFSRFDLVTVPSNHSKKELESHGINCIVVPNGIDTSRFSPKGAKAELQVPRGVPKALFVGRIVSEKNIGFLFRIAMHMKAKSMPALFVIAGKGPALGQFKAQAQSQGLDGYFHFAGFVDDSGLPGLYRSCDCLVQPSKFETQGLSVLEAMACGTPAIVLKGYAPAECVENAKNGFAIAEDPAKWSDAICKCAGSKAFSKKARATALGYSSAKAAKMMLAAYAKAKKAHSARKTRK